MDKEQAVRLAMRKGALCRYIQQWLDTHVLVIHRDGIAYWITSFRMNTMTDEIEKGNDFLVGIMTPEDNDDLFLSIPFDGKYMNEILHGIGTNKIYQLYQEALRGE